jgi:hypothetical protein
MRKDIGKVLGRDELFEGGDTASGEVIFFCWLPERERFAD